MLEDAETEVLEAGVIGRAGEEGLRGGVVGGKGKSEGF